VGHPGTAIELADPSGGGAGEKMELGSALVCGNRRRVFFLLWDLPVPSSAAVRMRRYGLRESVDSLIGENRHFSPPGSGTRTGDSPTGAAGHAEIFCWSGTE
jgi:hypothetical protein